MSLLPVEPAYRLAERSGNIVAWSPACGPSRRSASLFAKIDDSLRDRRAVATDDRQDLVGDVAGATGRCQEDEGRGNLFRPGGPFHRGLATELRNGVGVPIGRVERRPYRAWRHPG
jgi:hypothetical protein